MGLIYQGLVCVKLRTNLELYEVLIYWKYIKLNMDPWSFSCSGRFLASLQFFTVVF